MKTVKTYPQKRKAREPETLPGYPEYYEQEDIYTKGKEEGEIDPENIYTKKKSSYNDELNDELGENLDIPGSELDDELEDIGSEDEENNYYSLSDDRSNFRDDDFEDLL